MFWDLGQDEADTLAGKDQDHHRRDLPDAIARGDHPSWTLKWQVMPFEDARTYRINPFDLTKIWPHADDPLIEEGHANENWPIDADRTSVRTEQHGSRDRAHPTRCCWRAGSPTPTRIGTVSGSIATNRFRQCAAQRGSQLFTRQGTRVKNAVDPVYAPTVTAARQPSHRRTTKTWYADGDMVRQAYTLRADDDDFSQPRALIREVMDNAQRDRLVENIAGISPTVSARRFSSAHSNIGATSTRKPGNASNARFAT